jgi:hypothetical protein
MLLYCGSWLRLTLKVSEVVLGGIWMSDLKEFVVLEEDRGMGDLKEMVGTEETEEKRLMGDTYRRQFHIYLQTTGSTRSRTHSQS